MMASRSAVQAFDNGVSAISLPYQAQATAAHPKAKAEGNQKLRASRLVYESLRCFDILRCFKLLTSFSIKISRINV